MAAKKNGETPSQRNLYPKKQAPRLNNYFLSVFLARCLQAPSFLLFGPRVRLF